jgi:hypothetical protein
VEFPKMGGDEFSKKYLEKLGQDIDHAFGQYKAANASKNLFKTILAAIAAIKDTIINTIKGVTKSIVLKCALIMCLYMMKSFVLPLMIVIIWSIGLRCITISLFIGGCLLLLMYRFKIWQRWLRWEDVSGNL